MSVVEVLPFGVSVVGVLPFGVSEVRCYLMEQARRIGLPYNTTKAYFGALIVKV